MEYLLSLKNLLTYPLIQLSQATLTPGSILTGVALLLASRYVARGLQLGAIALLHRQAINEGTQFAVGKVVRWVVMVLGIMVAISSVGVNLNAAFAASAVLLVGIGFGLQKMAENFISGIILLMEQPVRKGDFIQVGESSGVIVDIGWRATMILTRDQITIILPNSELISGQVINHSVPTKDLRIRVDVGVASVLSGVRRG